MKELHDQLRILREHRGYTQDQVASKVDIGYSTYRKYESGQILPKAKDLIAFSRLYNVSIDTLLGLTEENSNYDPTSIAILQAIMTSDLPSELMTNALSKALLPLLDKNVSDTDESLVRTAMMTLCEQGINKTYTIDYEFPDGTRCEIIFDLNEYTCTEQTGDLPMDKLEKVHSDSTYQLFRDYMSADYDFNKVAHAHGSEEQRNVADKYKKLYAEVSRFGSYKRIVF